MDYIRKSCGNIIDNTILYINVNYTEENLLPLFAIISGLVVALIIFIIVEKIVNISIQVNTFYMKYLK